MQEFDTNSNTRNGRDRHWQTYGESIPVIWECHVKAPSTAIEQKRTEKRTNIYVIKTITHNIFRSTQGTARTFGRVSYYTRIVAQMVHSLCPSLSIWLRNPWTHQDTRELRRSWRRNEEQNKRENCIGNNKTIEARETSLLVGKPASFQHQKTRHNLSTNEKSNGHNRWKILVLRTRHE